MDQSENKTITSIAFDYLSNSNFNGDSFGIDIYMKNTDQSSFSSGSNWVLMSEDDKVFSGTVTLPSSSGWLTIELDDEFEYDYTKNLVIAINKTTNAGDGNYGTGNAFNTKSGLSTYQTVYISQSTDTSPYNPASPGSGTIFPTLSNIKITFKDESPLPVYPIPANLTASPIKTYEATLTWDEPENAISYNVKFHETSSSEWTTETGLATNTLLLSNLDANTAYEAQVQAVYSESNSDWSSVYSFTTLNLLRYTSTASYQSWHSTSAWTPSEVPTANHDVVIEKPAKINSGNAFANNITINAEATLDIQKPRTLTCNQITNNGTLVIADGAQLICNNSVNATLQKEITAAEIWGTPGADAWYFIASPVQGYATSNVIITGTGDTDLYSFDEASSYWFNAQGTTNAFTELNRGQGYLYANATGADLAFAGEMPATNSNIVKDLSYAGSGDAQGYNLMGNPFTCNLTTDNVKFFNGTENTNITSYYTVENDNDLTLVNDFSKNPIKPGRGFLIQATAAGQKLVFNPGAKRGETTNKPSFIVIEAGNNSFMDRACVQIGSGNTLRKMTINDNVSHVYVMQDDKDYAAATIEEALGEMPVCFKAAQDGQYTITVNPQEVEMGYLHLIDNVAGKDIDLLATPSYTFNAKADDYESRFRLVFSANMVNTDLNDDFAFFSNGQLVIANEGESLLQVIDVNGRIVMTESVNGTCSKAINVKAGVYVLRLIQGSDVKTQKIIVK